MNALRKLVLIRGFAWVGVLLGTVWWPAQGWANPTGGQVILGNANISAPDGGSLLINQLSDRAIIQWDSFSIANGELTRFAQPGSGSVALNRVVGGSPSMLNGLLQSNGNVWLMNSSGVIVGPTGMVDVGGFMASTLDMSNDEFMRGGSFRLSGGSTAAVRNLGTIKAAGGDVYLVAHEVENSGVIGAAGGTVALAGGSEVLINPGGAYGEKVFVSAGNGSVVNSGQITSGFAELKAHGNVGALAVQNSGAIRASGAERVGGRVVLRAGDGDIRSTGLVEAVGNGSLPGSIAMQTGSGEVRIGGLLRARSETGNGGDIGLVGRSVTLDSGAEVDASGPVKGGAVDVKAGEIVIYGNSTLGANGAAGGAVRLEATTGGVLMAGSVSAEGTSGAGGKIAVTGPQVLVKEGAEMKASGATGGEIQLGGGLRGQDSSIANAQAVVVDQGVHLAADGRNGDGGRVTVYADGTTRFDGRIDARAVGVVGNGGFVEVSGKQDLRIGGDVNTSAAAGRTGTFLIDPADVMVSAAGGTYTGAWLSNQLMSNNVIVNTSGVGGTGNITVRDPVQWASDNSLALLAHNDILVQSHIRNAGGAWNIADPLGVNQKNGTGNIYLVGGWNGTAGSDLVSFGANPGTYLNDNFGPGAVGSTYGVGGKGNVVIQAGWRDNGGLWENSANNGVVVGSRYGNTGVAANSFRMYGNTATYGFSMLGFRDNGRIGNLTWTDNGNGIVEAGELATDEDNYWWANLNPNSALPGQGLALNAIGTGDLKNADTSDLNLNTDSDRSVNTGVITGADAVAHVAAGGVVGEAASIRQPEWHQLQAYDNTRLTDATYAANASAIRGGIAVNAARDVSVVAGINEGFAQIGHVGANGSANFRTVHAGDGTLLFYADRNDDGIPATDANRQEGTTTNANRSGAAEVDGAHVFGSNIDVNAGLGGSGYLMLYSNRGTSAFGYTQIGHGGARTAGVREGDITVDAEDGVFEFGGAGSMSYSAIGHVTADHAHTGRSHQYTGDISVTTRGPVMLQAHQFGLTEATNMNRAFVQIGHGGPISSNGDSGRNSDGSLVNTANTTDAPNQIRLGRNVNLMLRSNRLEGSITVSGDRGVALEGGNRVFNSAQIGHNATQWGNDAVGGRGGSNAGNPTTGYGSNSAWHIDPVTGAISGSDPNNPGAIPYYTGGVKVNHGATGIQVTSSAGPISLLGGTTGRYNYTNISPAAQADSVRLSYAMIGSGGYAALMGFEPVTTDPRALTPWSAASGDVRVSAFGDVEVLGGSMGDDFAQIGNGGSLSRSPLNLLDEGSITGNIEVVSQAGNVTLRGGDAVGLPAFGIFQPMPVRERMYSMVGHGGVNAYFGRIEGDLLVRAVAGNVTLQGGRGDLSFAMVGSGGPGANDGANTNQAAANRGFDGKITVIAAGDVNVLGGAETALDAGIDPGSRVTWRFGRDNTNGTEVFLNYAQIGHGGPNTQAEIGASTDSTIEVFGTDVNIKGGEGMLSYARIGHGGSSNINLDFDLNLDRSGNNVIPTGANSADALDVGYLFLIRPGAQISAGPDGILNTGDDGINDGYAEVTYNLDLSGFGDNPDVRFFALNPGTVGNFAFSLTYGGGTGTLSAAVATWNAANPTKQIGFVGRDLNPTDAPRTINLTLSGGVNNRFGADGMPGGTDDARLSTTVPGAFDDGSMQSRQAPTDGRNGDVHVHASRDLTMIGGNRGNENSNLAESFAFVQIGHGGPGGQGPTSGNIDVTVGRNLYIDSNFGGDGVSDFAMDPSKFLNLGTPDQAVLSLLFQTRGGSSNGAVVTLNPTLTLQQNLDSYNAGRPFNDQVEINPAFTNAGGLRFKSSQTVTLAGGRNWATAQSTVPMGTGAPGPVTLTAALAGAGGNNIAFLVLPDETLQDAIDRWNAGNPTNQVVVSSGNTFFQPANPVVQLAGGVTGQAATASKPIAWFAAKNSATLPDPVLTFTNNTIAQVVGSWNQPLAGGVGIDYNVAAQRDLRVGYYGIDFDRGGTTTTSAVVPVTANSFQVANAAVVAVGARVTHANLPAGTFVVDVNPGTRTVTLNNAPTAEIASGQSIEFTIMGLDDISLATGSLNLSGGQSPYIDWNARGPQNAPAASSFLNFMYGAPAPTTLGVNTVKGDAYAKIGHGEDVRNLIREPGMYLNNTFAYVPSSGDISVAVGVNASLVGASVGHVNSQEGSTFTRYVSGDTYMAVSRLDPSAGGTGVLSATTRGIFNTVFSSGRDGFESEMRFYGPTERSMSLDASTRLNAEYFVAPAVFGRADSSLESEFVLGTNAVSVNLGVPIAGAPYQSFGPLGSYQVEHGIGGIGNYTLFYSAAAPFRPEPASFRYSPDQARDLAVDQQQDQIYLYDRVEESSTDNRTFTFANYWSNEGEWRTSTYRVNYMGGLGGGNALVLDESGQWVPMPINLDPNAKPEGSRKSTPDTEAGQPGVPVPPAMPKEEKKDEDGAAQPGGVSTEGTGVNTTATGESPAAGADMGGAEAPKPNTEGAAPAPAPAAAPAKDPFSF